MKELPALPVFFYADQYQVIEVRSGEEGTLAVFERAGFGGRCRSTIKYLLGSSGAAPDMQRQAYLPLLLHPAPERVAFIGLGTGSLRRAPSTTRRCTASPPWNCVRWSLRRRRAIFSSSNQNIFRRPEAKVYVEDARTYIAAARNRFDVIVGDLFTPWRPGESRICSLEQFRAAREALRPGGIFCQCSPCINSRRNNSRWLCPRSWRFP